MFTLHGVKIEVMGQDPISLTRRTKKGGAAVLGRLTPGTYKIRVTVPPGHGNYRAFTVQGNGNVQGMKEIDSLHNPDGRTYLKKVTVRSGNGAYPFTLPSGNNLRLLRTKRGGEVELWEISLVGQDGVFYLSVRKYFQGPCYRGDIGLVCPGLERWPQVAEFIEEVMREQQQPYPLPPIADHQPVSASTNALDDNQGKVLWFAPHMGFGAVQTNQGQARVHWTQIKSSGGFACLDAGDLVEFGEIKPPTVRAGQRPTSFKLEVNYVRVL